MYCVQGAVSSARPKLTTYTSPGSLRGRSPCNRCSTTIEHIPRACTRCVDRINEVILYDLHIAGKVCMSGKRFSPSAVNSAVGQCASKGISYCDLRYLIIR